MRMLEGEGFHHEGYIDIFDGGPTMAAPTDKIRTVRDAKTATLIATDATGGQTGLIAKGRLEDFVCVHGTIGEKDGDAVIDAESARLLGVSAGDEIVYVAR